MPPNKYYLTMETDVGKDSSKYRRTDKTNLQSSCATKNNDLLCEYKRI